MDVDLGLGIYFVLFAVEGVVFLAGAALVGLQRWQDVVSS